MKKKFFVGLAIAVAVIMVICFFFWEPVTMMSSQFVENFKAFDTAAAESARQAKADYVIGQIRYIKDPRTNLCFACTIYGQGGCDIVGTLAWVPEEAIPPELITVANVPPGAQAEKQ